jgi:nicotinamidase-related amidase
MKDAPLPPIGRSNTALVLHDMQNDFIKASLSRPEMQVVV